MVQILLTRAATAGMSRRPPRHHTQDNEGFLADFCWTLFVSTVAPVLPIINTLDRRQSVEVTLRSRLNADKSSPWQDDLTAGPRTSIGGVQTMTMPSGFSMNKHEQQSPDAAHLLTPIIMPGTWQSLPRMQYTNSLVALKPFACSNLPQVMGLACERTSWSFPSTTPD